jgi:hypothetical protein
MSVKVLALLLVLAGLVIAIVPQFTNCEARGGTMPTASTTTRTALATYPAAGAAAGNEAAQGTVVASVKTVATSSIVPKMKCLWSARGGLVVGISLAIAGGLLFFAQRRETRRAIGILAACLGLFTLLLPTTLIGTCGSAGAVYNTTMKPIMLVAGGSPWWRALR